MTTKHELEIQIEYIKGQMEQTRKLANEADDKVWGKNPAIDGTPAHDYWRATSRELEIVLAYQEKQLNNLLKKRQTLFFASI